MKTIRPNWVTGFNCLKIILTVAAFSFASCTAKHTFPLSSVVPAAEGWVKIKKDKNTNYRIDLNVIRLADSKRLNPQKDFYMVWMETDQNGIKNLGKLKTSAGFLSGALKSSFKTVSPLKPTTIFITAENNSNIQSPEGQEVLRTNSF